MPARKAGISLPSPIVGDDYPDGDGPQWISTAIGAPGSLTDVVRYIGDDTELTTLELRFANGKKQRIHPARRVGTRYLADTLGALGFPIPYYQLPQLALLGQAIGRVADRGRDLATDDLQDDTVSIVAGWLIACITKHAGYVLHGRAGADVRAAIEHVRRAKAGRGAPVPLVADTGRGTLLAWTSAAQTVIREHLGPTPYGTIGLALAAAGANRERLAARPGPGQRNTQEIPVYVLPNGWQGIEVEMPRPDWPKGPTRLRLLESVVDTYTHARANARASTNRTQRSTTPNGQATDNGRPPSPSINYDALRRGHA
jgi:hypothetical protein